MNRMVKAREVAKILSVSESKAYKVVKNLNEQLQKEGYLTISGRVPVQFLKERFKLENIDVNENEI